MKFIWGGHHNANDDQRKTKVPSLQLSFNVLSTAIRKACRRQKEFAKVYVFGRLPGQAQDADYFTNRSKLLHSEIQCRRP